MKSSIRTAAGAIWCVFGLLAATNVCGQVKDPVLSIDRLGYPDAITTTPEWGEPEVPFEMTAYLGTPAEHRAAKYYFDALFEFNHWMAGLFPELRELEDRLELDPQYKLIHDRDDRFDEFLDRIDWEVDKPDSEVFGQLEPILEEYQIGFEKLKLAQQHEKVVFPVGFEGLKSEHEYAIRRAMFVLIAQARREIHQDNLVEACTLIEMALRFSRDIMRRGDWTTLLVSTGSCEESCYREVIPAFLDSPNVSIDNCRQLIGIIKQQQQQLINDPIVEADKLHYCFLRNILFQIRNDAYPAKGKAESFPFVSGLESPSSVLLVELVDFHYFRLNHEMLRMRLEKVAIDNPEISDAMSKLPPGTESDNSIDRMLFQMLVQFEGLHLTANEFQKEIDVLNQRHREMVAACSQPFPQKMDKLKLLESAWTTDDSWKSTKLLRFFKPFKLIPYAGVPQRVETRRNGWQCMAALALWNLENDTVPESLESFLKPASIEEVPRDPYSGSPLKMSIVDGKVLIYSVGPDGDDDGGRPQESSNPQSAGDIVFQLKR